MESTTSFTRRPSYRRAIKRASVLDPDISSESAPSIRSLNRPSSPLHQQVAWMMETVEHPDNNSRRRKNGVAGQRTSSTVHPVMIHPCPARRATKPQESDQQLCHLFQAKVPCECSIEVQFWSHNCSSSGKGRDQDLAVHHRNPAFPMKEFNKHRQMPHESDLFSMINHPSESDIDGNSGQKIIRQMSLQIKHESDLFSMLNHPSSSDLDGGQMDNCSMDNHAGEESSLGSQHPTHVSHRRSFNGSNSRRVDFRQKYRRYTMLYCQRLPTVMEDTKLEVIAFV